MMVGSVTSGNKGTMQDFSLPLLLFPCHSLVGEDGDDGDDIDHDHDDNHDISEDHI